MKKINKKPPKIQNQAFRKKFKQQARILFKSIKEDILDLRKEWKIPSDGFKGYEDNEFIEWIKFQEKDDFLNISVVLNKFKNISARPKYFLIKILASLENNEYPDNLYFLGTLEEFYFISREKPMPGIIHYILFNNILVPESNDLQLTTNKFGYITLNIGPNATKQDVNEMWTYTQWLQENLPGYKKNKTKVRKERNVKIDEKLLDNPSSTYELFDDFNYNDSRKNSKKNLSCLRQKKKRLNSYKQKNLT
jgi:hypothetical protein